MIIIHQKERHREKVLGPPPKILGPPLNLGPPPKFQISPGPPQILRDEIFRSPLKKGGAAAMLNAQPKS